MNADIGIAGVSLAVSALAYWRTWRADRRGEIATRTQMFLALRTRFLDLLHDLPPEYADEEWDASLPAHRAAAIRYWHHAFDEWYIAKHLNLKLMGQLWDEYYRSALLGGLRHYGLRRTFSLASRTDALWNEFADELARIWRSTHPDDSRGCQGLACDHP